MLVDDGVFEALAELDAEPPAPTVEQAIARIHAKGLGTEATVLLGRGDAAWSMLRSLRDALRRLDPAWCATHGQEQISDEDLDKAIATLEDLLEDHDAHGVKP